MKYFTDLIKKASEKIKSTDSTIQIVSHLDCDGIASASIIASTLIQIDKGFQITVIKGINPEIIKRLKERNSDLIIFTDIGSGYLDDLRDLDTDIIILDHHKIEGSASENIIHINPEEFELNLAGAGTTYLLAREILQNNNLAPLAIVGTIGDVSYSTNSRIFETPLIETKIGLNIIGRFSKPIHQALMYLKIPEINNYSKAIQFLNEIGISPQENGDWRTFNDLTDKEKKKLTDSIVKEFLKNGNFEKDKVFGDVLTLKNFPDELRDAKEFATILNACANMNDPAIGIALCLGSRRALEYSRGLLRGYKRLIANSLNWIRDNPQNIRQTDFATYILAGDAINENLIGTIVSMLFKEDNERVLIGFADAEDGIKISARSKNVNIQNVIVEAARKSGGRGGGHEFAAGATIPRDNLRKFIEICEEILKNEALKKSVIS